MIGHATSGQITQGTIFSCALAEDYANSNVLGIIVTARCDAANDKVDTYNYIPLVTFEDWSIQDGSRILSNRIFPSALGELKKILAEAGLAESLISTISPTVILRSIFRDDLSSVSIKKLEPRFAKAENRYSSALAQRKYQLTSFERLAFLRSQPSDFKSLSKELIQNSLADYYYLRSSTPGEACRGYVALLREMRHIPRDLATAIGEGIDLPAYKQMCASDARNVQRLGIISDDHFAMPLGVVQSPHIELLMQRFTMLFSRIGVADPEPELLPYLQSMISLDVQA
ncbi:hypothetical protein [Mesorhizobium sp. M0091]|uniref:hypothetical protein n=1 Tax=Mesorhizobium sp. M0091 TaxID=2956875 RepID=UPI003334EF9B